MVGPVMIKWRHAAEGLARLVWDPFDFFGAMIFFDGFADTPALRAAYARMLRDLAPEARERLRALTLEPVDVPALLALPEGTLGRAYGELFRRDGVTPDAQVRAHPGLAETFARDWVYLRFCRVHDFHHVLLGFDVDPQGEMGLQAFNLRNFGEPFAALAMLSAPVTALRYGGAARMAREVRRGWGLGAALPNLFTAPFEAWFEEPLDAVRARVGLTRAAPTPTA
jgi:ubiquinone biosynthesis protein COQ4